LDNWIGAFGASAKGGVRARKPDLRLGPAGSAKGKIPMERKTGGGGWRDRGERDHKPELPERTHFNWAPRVPSDGTVEEIEAGFIENLQKQRAFISRSIALGEQVLLLAEGFSNGMVAQVDYFYTRFRCTPIMDVYGVGDDLRVVLLVRESDPGDRAQWETRWRTWMRQIAYGVRRDDILEKWKKEHPNG